MNASGLPGTATTTKCKPADNKRSSLGLFVPIVLLSIPKGARSLFLCLDERFYSPSPASARVGGMH